MAERKARDFISYQDPLESDADMIGRRQRFLQALLKGLGENNAFLLQRGPFRMLRSLLRTNLPPRALGSFIAVCEHPGFWVGYKNGVAALLE